MWRSSITRIIDPICPFRLVFFFSNKSLSFVPVTLAPAKTATAHASSHCKCTGLHYAPYTPPTPPNLYIYPFHGARANMCLGLTDKSVTLAAIANVPVQFIDDSTVHFTQFRNYFLRLFTTYLFSLKIIIIKVSLCIQYNK